MHRLLLPAIVLLASQARAADPGIDFFESKIRPVLAEHCYKCHSVEAKKNRGGLYLDTRSALRKGGESGPAVVPGKPAESVLLKAVRYDTLKMPPKGKLPDHVIADLEKWISQGAPDPREDVKPVANAKTINIEEGRKFWAYQPVKRQPAPKVGAWARTDIDRFILAKLEEKGLNPVDDAEPEVLLRRLYFDLIGLPPTPEEVAEFVSQSSAGLSSRLAALEKVVDRLLASPHFGERWGRHWLDVARYADSTGGGRSMLLPDAWRYRDYVIDSFNRDKPYDRFIREQIAGDLLTGEPEASATGVVGLAFLALGPTNYERQDKDALEMDVIDEQLDTIGRAFLGMTIGCARCHDHKFDPIPTQDYYALAGIFKSSQTLIHENVSKWVEVALPASPEQELALKKHQAAVAELQVKLKQAQAKTGAIVASATAKGIVPVKNLPGIVLDDSQAKKVGQWTASKYSGSYIGDGYLHDGNMDRGSKTLTFVPEIPKAGKYEVRFAYVPGSNRASKVPVTVLHLDGEQTFQVNEKEPPPIEGRFVSIGTFRFDSNGQWFVMISNEAADGHVVVDAVQFLPEEQADKPAEKQPATKTAAPDDVRALEAELKKLQASAPILPKTMGVREAAKIGDARICIRGNHLNLGEPALRGSLQVATPPGAKIDIPPQQSGRLQLANWLASRDNPLTARVMANRVWHWLIGQGIVRTVDTFGVTGELPSHPELLDYLALKFMGEPGAPAWSIKKLIREIVLSRTYQLSSKAPTTIDPENRLLSRMNRRRLEAEQIRDTMLVVSGKLDLSAGGQSIRQGTGSEYGYAFTDHRRSVYTPIFRNQLHELFEAFDFPDPNVPAGRRNVATVATQALYLMNSPFVIEQARSAAQRTLAEDLEDSKRIELAYRRAVGRPPTAKEGQAALQFIAAAGAQAKAPAWERFYLALFGCIDFRYVN